MCQIASWIKYEGQILFLTDDDLRGKRGHELRTYLDSQYEADKIGHGAIRWWYNLNEDKGADKECIDFSSPDNFPVELVEAIKNGRRRSFFSNDMLVILKQAARAEYEKIRQAALAKYLKIQQAAEAEYLKIQQPAEAKYLNIEQAARAEYDKIEQPAEAKYEKIQQATFWRLFMVATNRIDVWK